MSSAVHVDSYYAATAQPHPERPALAGTGRRPTSAWSAAASPAARPRCTWPQRGYSVVLLEEHRIGWGASGRSGAQALSGVACGQDKLEQLIGAADARRVWDVSVEGLALQRELIATHGIDCDYVAGQLHVAIKPRQDAELRAEVEELHGTATATTRRSAGRARRTAHPAGSETATSRRSSTPTAGTCIRSTTRWGSRPRPNATACASSRAAA